MVMPSTVTAVQSNTITLICQVFGIPTPTVQWTSSSSNVALATNGTFTITTISNGNNVTSNLTISPVVKNDTTYTCTGSNGQINLIDSPENASSQVEIQGCYNFKSIFNSDLSPLAVPANITALTSSPAVGVEGQIYCPVVSHYRR